MLDSINKMVTITFLDENKKDFTGMVLNTISHTKNIGSLKEFF